MRFDLRDLLAGLAVAGLMLPEGVAYAGIAGLPAADALAAGIAGGLAYALIGRSRFAIVAPTSSSAAILAAALTALAGPGIERELMAGVMVAMVGAIFLAAAILRLGSLSAFISRPVLRGFAFGLALTIALRQLPKLLGLAGIAPGNVFAQAWEIARTLGTTRPLSAALGVGTLALLLILRRWSRLPATLLVLLASIALSAIFDLGAHGVVLAGTIRLQPPLLALPELTAGQWARAVQLAAPIAL
ncbi:MAG: SulP family inorganic anion transporter, partial [Sphingomonadales bacterium]|nr:SulP family inorganic anion transporter [Sphingomonadales bacterium]